jgi:hypothetical protein
MARLANSRRGRRRARMAPELVNRARVNCRHSTTRFLVGVAGFGLVSYGITRARGAPAIAGAALLLGVLASRGRTESTLGAARRGSPRNSAIRE